jgi:hypothetical protein
LPIGPAHTGRCPATPTTLTLDEALRRLPRVDLERQKGPRPEALANLPGFANVVESLSGVTDPGDAISRHTAAFARVLIAHPEIHPVPLVHAITAPTALQNLPPYLPYEFGAQAYPHFVAG